MLPASVDCLCCNEWGVVTTDKEECCHSSKQMLGLQGRVNRQVGSDKVNQSNTPARVLQAQTHMQHALYTACHRQTASTTVTAQALQLLLQLRCSQKNAQEACGTKTGTGSHRQEHKKGPAYVSKLPTQQARVRHGTHLVHALNTDTRDTSNQPINQPVTSAYSRHM